jgi:hypothetical protein
MSSGYGFLEYVESLRAVGFPTDKVTGGDIYSVYKAGLSIREAVYRLHTVAEFRRKMKQDLKTPE